MAEERNHTVNKRSSAYMFGQIMTRLDEGDKIIVNLAEKVDGVSKAVYGLPCSVHEERLKTIDDWQEKYDNKKEKESEQSFKWKHGLIIAVISILTSSSMTFALTKIFQGG